MPWTLTRRADEVIGAVAMAGFSRLPIHEGDLDHIIGFVYTKDLLLRQHMGWPIELRKLVRPALLVPESLRIDKLLERFRQKRTQMAIVLDEFGGTEGLVTMEDVLEELVGEIHDEHRAERQQQIVARDDSSWFVDAGMPLNELLERMDMARSPRFAAGRREHGGGTGAFPAGTNPRDGRCRHLGGVDAGSRGHGWAAGGTDFNLSSRLTVPSAGIKIRKFELGVGGRPLLWEGRRTGNPVRFRDGPAAVTECFMRIKRRSSSLLAIVAPDSGVTAGITTRRPDGPNSEVRRPTSA